MRGNNRVAEYGAVSERCIVRCMVACSVRLVPGLLARGVQELNRFVSEVTIGLCAADTLDVSAVATEMLAGGPAGCGGGAGLAGAAAAAGGSGMPPGAPEPALFACASHALTDGCAKPDPAPIMPCCPVGVGGCPARLATYGAACEWSTPTAGPVGGGGGGATGAAG